MPEAWVFPDGGARCGSRTTERLPVGGGSGYLSSRKYLNIAEMRAARCAAFISCVAC